MRLSLSSKWPGIVALIAFQVLVTVISFATLPREWLGISIGVGDCQLALAMLLAISSSFPMSQRIAVALLLIFAAMALHYVAIVWLAYPFVFAEEYLVGALVALTMGGLFWYWRIRHGLRLVNVRDQPLQERHRGLLSVSLADILLWLAVVGSLIAIGKRAMVQTDVSGMSDPWESVEFALLGAMEFLLWRLPVLAGALLLYATVFCTVCKLLLTEESLTVRRMLAVTGSLAALMIGEVALGSAMLWYDKPWPCLPAGMFYSVMFASDVQLSLERPQDEERYSRWYSPIGLTMLTRAIVLLVSLVLLRWSGYRFASGVTKSNSLKVS